jgi:hypothetical protein
MPNIEIKNLPPTPLFVHRPEGHVSNELTQERMKVIRGGSAVMGSAPIGAMPVQYPGQNILTALANEWGVALQLPVEPPRNPGTIQNW